MDKKINYIGTPLEIQKVSFDLKIMGNSNFQLIIYMYCHLVALNTKRESYKIIDKFKQFVRIFLVIDVTTL